MRHRSGVVALDGHDGAGKTTLARALAERIRGTYCRPFHGPLGAALLDAGARRDLDGLIAIGAASVQKAIDGADTRTPVVLDRGWMTVASLVEHRALATFAARWPWWMPTALCWADLATTLERLSVRSEAAETAEVHRHYLAVYRDLAERSGSVIVRTDMESIEACVETLADWFGHNPLPPIL